MGTPGGSPLLQPPALLGHQLKNWCLLWARAHGQRTMAQSGQRGPRRREPRRRVLLEAIVCGRSERAVGIVKSQYGFNNPRA